MTVVESRIIFQPAEVDSTTSRKYPSALPPPAVVRSRWKFPVTVAKRASSGCTASSVKLSVPIAAGAG